jgi:adenylate cyclase
MTPIVEWLLSDGRDQPDICSLLTSLARLLEKKGIPLFRIHVGVEELHPELIAETFVWDRDRGTEIIGRPHGTRSQEFFQNSPIPLILAGTPMIRVNLQSDGTDIEYLPGASFKADGVTEAVFFALPFSGKRTQILCLVTDNPDGFSDAQLAKVAALLAALGCIIEVMTAYDTASGLLDIYVGHDAGRRILSGEIRRGIGETVRAALWFCDLAKFTTMSQVLPRDELIAILNQYFDAMAIPVENHGGSILKFLGDGMLAFFPLPSDKRQDTEICSEVARAAREAVSNIARLNTERYQAGTEPLDYGIALHVGDVMYGNVGAADRLDFTLIGPAVNYVARLETLSRSTRQSVIISSDFAMALNTELPKIGAYELRGIEGRQDVFGLGV